MNSIMFSTAHFIDSKRVEIFNLCAHSETESEKILGQDLNLRPRPYQGRTIPLSYQEVVFQ